jgi:hypothetical protein
MGEVSGRQLVSADHDFRDDQAFSCAGTPCSAAMLWSGQHAALFEGTRVRPAARTSRPRQWGRSWSGTEDKMWQKHPGKHPGQDVAKHPEKHPGQDVAKHPEKHPGQDVAKPPYTFLIFWRVCLNFCPLS